VIARCHFGILGSRLPAAPSPRSSRLLGVSGGGGGEQEGDGAPASAGRAGGRVGAVGLPHHLRVMPRRQPLRPDGNASNPNPTWSIREPSRWRGGVVVIRCERRRHAWFGFCLWFSNAEWNQGLGCASAYVSRFLNAWASAVFACTWSCCCSVLVSFDRCDGEFGNRSRWRQVLALGVCLHVLINNLTKYHSVKVLWLLMVLQEQNMSWFAWFYHHVGCLFHLGMWYCFYDHKLKQTRSFSPWVVTIQSTGQVRLLQSNNMLHPSLWIVRTCKLKAWNKQGHS
jgi:hypothetical protein